MEFFYPDLKKQFSVYKKIKEKLENMCKEQETKISQADLKINQTGYWEMKSKITEI